MPLAVADRRELAGRLDDVGEQNGSENAVDLYGRTLSADESRYLVEKAVIVSDARSVRTIPEHRELRSCDVIGQVRTLRKRD
jgi:hypothetical protein